MAPAAEALLVAAVSIIPGIGGVWYSIRVRRDHNDHRATEFGTKMAEAAFKNMETQVARLTLQQQSWDQDRDQWDRDRESWSSDKNQLVGKINVLTDQLRLTNSYLQLLLTTLDRHQIPHPTPPIGWTDPPGIGGNP